MQVFYSYTIDIQNGVLTLQGDEANHCVKVLRKRVGDDLQVIDGKGSFYTVEIQSIGKGTVKCRILNMESDPKQREYYIHLVVSPTKSLGRIEWAVEKMTEMGIDEISFVKLKRSIRTRIKLERLKRIALAATKQSLQLKLPIINDIQDLTKVLNDIDESVIKLVAHLDEQSGDISKNYKRGSDVIIFVGPEGDFVKEELTMLEEHGFQMVHLGKTRLRTETAAMAAVHTIHVLNQINDQ